MEQPLLAGMEPTSPRARVLALVGSRWFANAILAVILINAVLLGLDADPALPRGPRLALALADAVITGVFVLELGLKLYAFRGGFFRSGWNVFDLVVVGISLAPASGAFSILRALRVFRVLRAFSLVPALRRVVDALFKAIPGMGAILAVLGLLFYVAAVMATTLFGSEPRLEAMFGSVAASAFTLFQVMTLDGWSSEVVREVMASHPWAWAFFIPFIVLTSFAVLNLFIAVIVEALQAEQGAEMSRSMGHVEQELQEIEAEIEEADDERLALIRTLQELRGEVAALRAEMRGHSLELDPIPRARPHSGKV